MDVTGSGSYSSIYTANAGVNRGAERIASGQRINHAGDDAAGLSISNRMSSQINGFNQSVRNANDGISMLQTKDAALQGINAGLDRIRELSLQASNGTLNDKDRSLINKEAQQLLEGIGQTVENSRFNSKPLLTGGEGVDLQLGPSSDDQISLTSMDFAQRLEEAGFADIDLSSTKGATSALSVLTQVQEDISLEEGNIGAAMNRLDSSVQTLSSSAISAEQSRSRIQDADIAKEVSNKANEQVKFDVAIAMQALANQNKGSVLRLLGE